MEKEVKLIWINKVVANNNLYLVYVNDNNTPYKFTEEQMISNRIIKGNSFYEEEWLNIINSLSDGILYEKALNHINYKPRSKFEIINYLENLNASSDVIDNIVNKLEINNYINDDRYAKFFVLEEIRKQKGPNAIKYVLLTKGINEDIINKYLSEYTYEFLYENALDMANKTLKTVLGLPVSKQKESVYTRLYRMGYDSLIISNVINSLNYSNIDFDKLKKEYLKIKDKLVDENKIIQKLLSKGYSYIDIIKVINKE